MQLTQLPLPVAGQFCDAEPGRQAVHTEALLRAFVYFPATHCVQGWPSQADPK
jgi:hypothetical protein